VQQLGRTHRPGHTPRPDTDCAAHEPDANNDEPHANNDEPHANDNEPHANDNEPHANDNEPHANDNEPHANDNEPHAGNDESDANNEPHANDDDPGRVQPVVVHIAQLWACRVVVHVVGLRLGGGRRAHVQPDQRDGGYVAFGPPDISDSWRERELAGRRSYPC
jgi:hypothetical protein